MKNRLRFEITYTYDVKEPLVENSIQTVTKLTIAMIRRNYGL
ncbi:MAG: hypothetical protein Q4A75_09910 [Peptostreptococcaceae bacterium]|nr:hypothetical protein [Peptostreptococcaceae bacterium]